MLFRRSRQKKKKWLSPKLRAALAGALLCLGALYGLTRYWDISTSTLVNYLLGSVAFIVGTMLGGVLLVAILVGCRRLLGMLRARLSRD